MNRMRAAIGMFGLASQPGLVSPDYAVLEPTAPIDAKYYLQLFKTRAAGSVFLSESKGLGTGHSGFMRLYTERFGVIKLPLPPLEEQKAIVDQIDIGTTNIDRSVERIQREIALVQEYRARLIADVVTGKLDVRDAKLPDDLSAYSDAWLELDSEGDDESDLDAQVEAEGDDAAE